MFITNSLGIDTVRFVIPSKTLDKFLSKLELEVVDKCKNYLINQYLDKEVKNNRDYDVKYVVIGNSNNLSGYILIKANMESYGKAKAMKKGKLYYNEVIFAGLRQPTKRIVIGTYDVLSMFIKRFEVSTMDICVDGYHKTAISKANESKYTWMFKDYIVAFNDSLIHGTSFYINKPQQQTKDADVLKRILLYDKYAKESSRKDIPAEYLHWKRLEATVNIDTKLKSYMMDDCLEDMSNLVDQYFDTKVNPINLESLNFQLNLLKDRRTQKGIKSEVICRANDN